MDTTTSLTPGERATLASICEAFQPSLTAEPGDDPQLFAADSDALGVPRAAEDAIARLAPAQQAELRLLLRLLDRRVFGLLTTQVWRGATAMSLPERERL